MAGQKDPAKSWLQTVRTDLVEEYDKLHEAATAARFRAELAALPSPAGGR